MVEFGRGFGGSGSGALRREIGGLELEGEIHDAELSQSLAVFSDSLLPGEFVL